MSGKKINVAVVGLGFGGAFVPIWRDHPDVGEVTVCDMDGALKSRVAEYCGITRTCSSLDEVLSDASIDAVHLLTGIPAHAEQTIRVLESGKHCACAVPMATSLADIRSITEAVRKSGKIYMLMETTLYTYQYFYVRQMLERGEMGRIQLLRGCHYQDLENWPSYWNGLPPFWYGSHALAPLITLSGSRVSRVSCLGSGTMRPELVSQYGNPYPVETAHLRFENGLAGEATRSLFETARTYQEGLFVYGSKKSFEWGFADGDAPIETRMSERAPGMRGTPDVHEAIEVPNYYADLPEALWKFTVGKNYDATNPQLSLQKGAGAGHHGAHAHLVNEFARAIAENRKPWIDEELGAHITATGVCAHESAMRDGEWIAVPRF